MPKYESIYYGIVQDTLDESPENKILVTVPEILGPGVVLLASPRGVPAGKGWGFNYVPKKNEAVWITFRFGALRFPLWEPGYYAVGERPQEFNRDIIGFKFRDGSLISHNEAEGTFLIKVKGKTITIDDSGIYIDAGDQDVIIHNDSSSVSLTDSGIDIDSDNPITIGGSNEVLFSKVPGASQILDVSEIGVSSKVKVG